MHQNLWQKKWIEVNDLSSGQYCANKNIRFKIWTLRSDLCDYSDAYIVVRGRISVRGTNDVSRKNKNLTSRIMLHLDHVYQKSITHS